MSYQAGEPLTGFSLILDGNEEAVEAILAAAMKEMQRQFDKAEKERARLDLNLERPLAGYVRLPVYPVHGEIHLRTGP